MKRLTVKQETYIRARIHGDSPAEAYKRAFNSVNMKVATISNNACILERRSDIATKIRAGLDAALHASVLTAADVLSDWVQIARADPAELIRSRRLNCRRCRGIEHGYQWRNEGEWLAAMSEHVERGKPGAPPDGAGGFGFRGNLPPVATCPGCDGEGLPDVYIADINDVSPAARRLYAGIHRTKDGVRVLMRNQDAALDNIAKHLGMLVQHVKHTGVVGTAEIELNDQQRAALSSIIKGLV